MNEVLGSILPNAVAIAISPIPIIAVILMLMSSRPRRLGLAFLGGWLVGVLVATSVITLLAGVIPEPDASGGAQPVLGVIQLVLGIGLLLLGIRQWRSRPAPGVEAQLPAWMSKIDSMGALTALALAFALAAVNPKNLLVAAAAGSVIGRAGLDIGGIIVAIVCFTVVAALTVAAPVLFAVIAPEKAAPALASIRAWLAANNATIMTVVFAILGTSVIGKGIGAF
ncbi:MAG: GAP family protein [Microthrixaceae bacterium]|nr:GAP family protein [Microthrixaceae bacterium]